MKRLGDFLNMESFDLALLEEVGLCGSGVDSRVGGGQEGGCRRRHPPAGKARQAISSFPQVWSEQDFQFLRQKLSFSYPDAHYFRR